MSAIGDLPSDAALVSLVNKGGHGAFTVIYDRYAQSIYQQLYSVLGNTDTANDLLQDVFFSLWEKREGLVPEKSLFSYLYVSARNKVFDHLSRMKVIEKYMAFLPDHFDTQPCDTDHYLLAKELQDILETEKSKLPPRTLEIFELNREQELTYREIGKRLNISEKTAKKQVHNALRRLRMKLSHIMMFF